MSESQQQLRQMFLDGRISVEEYNALSSDLSARLAPDELKGETDGQLRVEESRGRRWRRGAVVLAGLVAVGLTVLGVFVVRSTDGDIGVGDVGEGSLDLVQEGAGSETADSALSIGQASDTVSMLVNVTDVSEFNPFPGSLLLRFGASRENTQHRLIPGENLIMVESSNLVPGPSGELRIVFFDSSELIGGATYFVRPTEQPGLDLVVDDSYIRSTGAWTEKIEIDRPNPGLDSECALLFDAMSEITRVNERIAAAEQRVNRSSSLQQFRDVYEEKSSIMWDFISPLRIREFRYLTDFSYAISRFDEARKHASDAATSSSIESLNLAIERFGDAREEGIKALFGSDECYR